MLAALPHVAFDGWSNSTFVSACRETDISEKRARLFCPRGALDLAVAFHKWGDDKLETTFKKEKISFFVPNATLILPIKPLDERTTLGLK